MTRAFRIQWISATERSTLKAALEPEKPPSFKWKLMDLSHFLWRDQAVNDLQLLVGNVQWLLNSATSSKMAASSSEVDFVDVNSIKNNNNDKRKDRKDYMQSNLPLLFANGSPISLESMKLVSNL